MVVFEYAYATPAALRITTVPKAAATTPRTFFQLQCRHQLPLRRGGRPPGPSPPGPSQSPPPCPFLRSPLRPGPSGVSQSAPAAFGLIRLRRRPTRLSSQSSGLAPPRPDRPNGLSQLSVPPIPFRRSRSLRSSLTSRRP